MLLGYRSKAPVICGVCGRLAHGTGYSEKDSADILWTCRKHVSLAKRVYRMKPGQLSQYENAAVTRAKEDFLQVFMGALFEIMWNDGVRSLEELDGERFAKIEKKARTDKGVADAFDKYMESYMTYLDKIMSGELPPF